jgi:hypothetical protein
MLQCPLFPQKQTFAAVIAMSALCQKRTRAVQQSMAKGLQLNNWFLWQTFSRVAAACHFCNTHNFFSGRLTDGKIKCQALNKILNLRTDQSSRRNICESLGKLRPCVPLSLRLSP